MKKLTFLAAPLALALLVPLTSFAAGIFPAGDNGYDISYNSAAPYPSSLDFGIVGVTDGRAYGTNPNLQAEFSWTQQNTTAVPPSLYMNLNAAVGSTAKGNTSAPKTCKKNDKACQGYNYGYNAAANAYAYAKSVGALSSLWWLDIETANSWSSSVAVNDATIQGAVDFFNNSKYPNPNQQSAQVGIYSTQSMWNKIAGNWTPVQTTIASTPDWVPVGSLPSAPSSCSASAFTPGGQVWLEQYQTSGSTYDHDYSCQ